MWSPALHSVRIAVTSAAWPVAVASAARPAFDRRHALLEHRHGRVGDARIDVAEGLQVEQARRVLGGVEHERGGLVDRRRARAGGRRRESGPRAGTASRCRTCGRPWPERPPRELSVIALVGSAPAGPGCGSRVARRYSEGGTPTWFRKKRVKLLCAEKPSSAETSAILPLARGQARDRGLDAQHVEVGARREAGAQLEQVVEARARQARPGSRARPC